MFNILIISRWFLTLKPLKLGYSITLRDNRVHFSGKVLKLCGRHAAIDHKLLSRYRSLFSLLSLLAVLCTFFRMKFFRLVSFFTIRAFFNSLLVLSLSFFLSFVCTYAELFYFKKRSLQFFVLYCLKSLLFMDAAFVW